MPYVRTGVTTDAKRMLRFCLGPATLSIRRGNPTEDAFMLACFTHCLMLEPVAIIIPWYLMNGREVISCSLARGVIVSISILLIMSTNSDTLLAFALRGPSTQTEVNAKEGFNIFWYLLTITRAMSSANANVFSAFEICNFSRPSFIIIQSRVPSNDRWGTLPLSWGLYM